MKTKSLILTLVLVLAQAGRAAGATQTKNNTAGALSATGSWVGGVVPTSADIALFDSTITGPQTDTLTGNTGGSVFFGELQITNPGGPVTIGSDTTTSVLELEGVVTQVNFSVINIGIDMSAATQDVNIGNANVSLVPLGGAPDENWLIKSGRTLTINGGVINGSSITISGGGNVVLQTTASTDQGVFTLKDPGTTLTVNAGSFATYALNNGTSLVTNQNIAFIAGITAVAGTSSFTASTQYNGTVIGNGNLNFVTTGASTAASTSLFQSFGGTALWGTSNASFRVSSGSSLANFSMATLDYGTGVGAGIYEKGGNTIVIGGVASTTGGLLMGNNGTSGAMTNIVGSANTDLTFGGKAQDGNTGTTTNNVVKVGTGTWTINGASGNVWTNTGTMSANGGTLKIDLSTLTTGVLKSTDGFNFGGGSLLVQGKGSGTSSQTVGAVTVTGAGGANLIVNPNGGTSTTLTMGNLTTTALGGSLNIQPVSVSNNGVTSPVTYGSGTAAITTTSNKGADGTYGGRVTFGSDWATTASVSTPFALSAYSGYTDLTNSIALTVHTTNDRLNNVGNTIMTGNLTVNSLKITNTGIQSLGLGGNTLTVTNGGLLFAGSADYSIGTAINNGTLKSGIAATSDLIIQQLGAGNLTINSVIANGNGVSQLTKAGFGTLTLAGTNTYTGVTNLNAGVLSISSNGNLGAGGTGATLNMNGGTLKATSTFTLDNGGGLNKRSVAIFGGGGTFDVTAGNTLTIDGVVSTGAANNFGPLIKTDSGTLVLSGSNTYGGATIISGGVLSVSSLGGFGTSGIGNPNNAAPALVLDGGTLRYTGANGGTNRTMTLTQNGGTLDGSGSGNVNFDGGKLPWAYTGSGDRTLTLTGSYAGANDLGLPIGDASTSTGASGVVSLLKTGLTTWTLFAPNNTYTGNTTITGGTLTLDTSATTNSIAFSPTIKIASGATLDVGNLSGSGIVLNSGQTLQGSGSVFGGVTVGAGAIINPGDAGVGNLTVTELTLNPGSTVNLEFTSTSTYDTITVGNAGGGVFALNGGNFNLYATGTLTPWVTAGTYNLFSYNGTSPSLTALNAEPYGGILDFNIGLSYTWQLSGSGAVQLVIGGAPTSVSNWVGSSGGIWEAAGNWNNNPIIPGHALAGDSVSFVTAGGGGTVNLGATSETLGVLNFNSTASYTLSGAGGQIYFNNGTGNAAQINDSSPAGSNTIAVPVTITSGGLAVGVSNSGETLNVTGVVSGPGGITKSGAGTTILSGFNAYTGATTVSGGKLVVDGSIATSSGVTIATLATLGGHGAVSVISGAGTVAPGNSPGILTATQVDPSGGLGFVFQFTQLGSPTYGNAAASGNDVLHITGATPFTIALNNTNTITLDFTGQILNSGDIYYGGFFTDSAVANALVSGATFVYTGLSGATVQFDGFATVPSAEFASGTVTNGQVMKFEVTASSVPEPSTWVLLAMGSAGLLALRCRRGKNPAAPHCRL